MNTLLEVLVTFAMLATFAAMAVSSLVARHAPGNLVKVRSERPDPRFARRD